jgi:hypothetical protein
MYVCMYVCKLRTVLLAQKLSRDAELLVNIITVYKAYQI